MTHPQARPPHKGFVYDAKHDSEVAPCVSIDPHCRILDLEGESDVETATHVPPDAQSAALANPSSESIPTGLHVRFRSRVRISAGMGRRRRLSNGLTSNGSSISGSPSSSISAPLRTHFTDDNGWTRLGSRLALPPAPLRGEYTNGEERDATRIRKSKAQRQRARSWPTFLDDDMDERTHLITPATRHSYLGNQYAHDWYHDGREHERQWRDQLVDEAFGKWPGRLVNPHWWWWHLEPILCCLCYTDDEL